MNDELKRAISIAQNAHNRNDGPADATAVSIGALICAVELLAGVRAEPSKNVGAFDDGIVNKLQNIYRGAYERTFVNETSNEWQCEQDGIRAILSELASMPVELPSQSRIIQAMRDEIRGWSPEKAVEFTRKRIAHFLVAKDIEIKEAKSEIESLKNRLAEQSTRESRLHVVLADHGLPTGPKALAAELASRAKAYEDDTRRIDSLVRKSAELTASVTIDGKTPVDLDNLAEKLVPVFEAAYHTGPNNQLASVRSGLRAVLAALPMPITQPVSVDGKTPGEVLILAQHGCRPSQVSREMLESAERDAIAVLRAFSQPSQTPSTNVAVEALERVADTANNGARRLVDDGAEHDRVLHEIWHDAIRSEIARLRSGPSQTTQDAVEALRRVRDAIDRIERMSNDTEYGKQWASVADMLEAIDDELAKLDTTKRCSATDSWATGERFACRRSKDHDGACDFGAIDEDYRRAASQA